MTVEIGILEKQIEELIRSHLDASHRAATAALVRAFSSSSVRVGAKRSGPSSRARSATRTRAELSSLCDELCQAVFSYPGSGMSVLADHVGKSSAELYGPMVSLKRAGRVRSVGQRQQTRYFPAVVRPSSDGG